jgi:hypothetical protein
MALVTFASLKARIAGLGCPVFGVSSNPSNADRIIARRVLSRLEDRSVLFARYAAESPEDARRAVLLLREQVTTEITACEAPELKELLLGMRATFDKFMRATEPEAVRHFSLGGYPGWAFNQVLGELPGVAGVHIVRLAVMHGLDVQDSLADILPSADVGESASGRQPNQ